MNNDYHLFRYVPVSSKTHLMNSKMKTIWFLLTLLSLVIIRDYVSLLCFLFFLFVIMYYSKISFINYLRGIYTLWPVYIAGFIITFLISLNVSFAFLTSIKLIFIILLFLIMTSTTSLSEIAWGLECTFNGLKKIKVPVSRISLRIAMDIKFISLIYDESKEIRKSMAYRGIPYKKGSLKSFKKMIVPVISISYKNSRRMVKIMRLRFYGNSKRRTNYHENKVTAFDKVLVVVPIVLLYVVIWLGWC